MLKSVCLDHSENVLNPLADPAIVAEIGRAWRQFQPDDPANRHEEGGYILLNPDLYNSASRHSHWMSEIAMVTESWLPRFTLTQTLPLMKPDNNGSRVRANPIGVGMGVESCKE